MKRPATALLVFFALWGCAADDTVTPPVYAPEGPEPANPVSCDYLDKDNVDSTKAFPFDGGPAGCVVNGAQCLLGTCDGGLAMATCYSLLWRYSCAAVQGMDANNDSAAE